ncbi:MAG TPA: DUF5132 domain-containing protein [Candidatus Obscuribacterales bacterium]
MFEEVLGFIGRPWLLAAAAVAAVVGTKTGRKVTRGVVKAAVKAGNSVGDTFKDASARVQEEFSDIVAEAKAEMSNHDNKSAIEAGGKKKKSSEG